MIARPVLIPPPTPPPHQCSTPGSLKPQGHWPRKMVPALNRDKPIPVPVIWEVGTLWQCHVCNRWWYCVAHQNRYAHGYQPAGRRWLPVRWYHRTMRKRIANNPVLEWGGSLVANLTLPPRTGRYVAP